MSHLNVGTELDGVSPLLAGQVDQEPAAADKHKIHQYTMHCRPSKQFLNIASYSFKSGASMKIPVIALTSRKLTSSST